LTSADSAATSRALAASASAAACWRAAWAGLVDFLAQARGVDRRADAAVARLDHQRADVAGQGASIEWRRDLPQRTTDFMLPHHVPSVRCSIGSDVFVRKL